MSPYTIYAYFNGEEIQGVLNAVVMLMGSGGDYAALIRTMAVIGLFLACCCGFVRARGEDAGMYLIVLALFYTGLFIPRVTVNIEDRGAGGIAGVPRQVANVPIGLAFFASATSHIGSWLTERSETFFSLPDTSLQLSRNGLMGGARALRMAHSASVPDPVLTQNITFFMRDCIAPELLTNTAAFDSLMQSTDIWADLNSLGLVNPGRLTRIASSSDAKSCKAAYEEMTPRVASAATSEMSRIARQISPHASTSAEANAFLASLLPAAEGLIMSASATTADAIRQRMLINALSDAPGNLAQLMGDPVAAQTALGAAMAASSANASYAVMAKVGQETLPLVRNAIELIVIGLFPIILLLVVIAGTKGGTVLRSYVMAMLWVQLWAPLYAIVNYVGSVSGARSMRAALEGIDGVSIQNAAALLNTAISAEAIAGMLTLIVPVIAYAVIRGGEVAMSGIASSVMGPATSAAGKAGSEIGTGNVSMGNMRWGNVTAYNETANKTDRSLGYVASDMAQIKTGDGSFTATPRGITGVTPNFGTLVGASIRTSSEVGNSISDSARGNISVGTSASLTKGVHGSREHSKGVIATGTYAKTVEAGVGWDQSTSSTRESAHAASTGNEVGLQGSTGHSERLALSSGAGIGIKQRKGFLKDEDKAGREENVSGLTEGLTGGAGDNAVSSAVAEGGMQQKAEGKDQSPGKKEGAATKAWSVSDTWVAPNISTGINVDSAEVADYHGSRRDTSSVQQSVSERFSHADGTRASGQTRNAVTGSRGTSASTAAQSGEKTEAAIKKEYRSSHDSSVSSEQHKSSAVGGSISINYTPFVTQDVLDSNFGGNPYAMLEAAQKNPKAIAAAAEEAGKKMAALITPSSGSPSGMDGNPVTDGLPDESAPGRKFASGMDGTKTQHGQDVREVTGDYQEYRQHADVLRGQDHVPADEGLPDARSQEVMNRTWDLARNNDGQISVGQGRQAVQGGINRVSEHIFNDNHGSVRMFLVALGAGPLLDMDITKSPQQIRDKLQPLVDDPQSVRRLGEIGDRGNVTDEDTKILLKRLNDLQ